MAVKQYPYKLFKKVDIATVQDENGDWTKGTSEWVEVGPCRDESNTKASVVNLVDGSAYVYSATVYMPKTTEAIKTGTMIQVKDGDNVRVYGAVNRFVTNQLNCQLWV
jgi:hypothetical protein